MSDGTTSRALADPMASVRLYLQAEKSGNTRRAYAADFDHYTAWCNNQDLQGLPAPPATVARYLAFLADSGLKASTIERRRAAIRYAHKAAGHEPPTASEAVKATMRGIRRTLRSRPVRKPSGRHRLVKLVFNRPGSISHAVSSSL